MPASEAVVKTIWVQPHAIVDWHVDARRFVVVNRHESLLQAFEYETADGERTARNRAVRFAKARNREEVARFDAIAEECSRPTPRGC